MGYTTEFYGEVTVTPPLNMAEGSYLNKFADSRRMDRKNGPYFVGESESDVINHNQPPRGQPGLWCQWVPNETGEKIGWDGGEKFYYAKEWMQYLVDHFIGADPLAKKIEPKNFSFLTGHSVRGIIYAEGEDSGDKWYLAVANNKVEEFKSKAAANKFLKDNPETFNVPQVPVEDSKSGNTEKIAKQKKIL